MPTPRTSGLPRRAPDDEIGNIRVHQRDAVGADDLLQGGAQRFHEQGLVPARIDHADRGVVINFSHQMREHFGIGLRSEVVRALLQQRVLDLLVIFDHAVVHEGEFAALVEMRMRILIGRFAVRRPASVADAVSARRGRFGEELREPGDAAGAFARLDMLAINDRDPGGIVTAIFEAAQTIEQDGRCFRTSDVSDNATHGLVKSLNR